MHPFVFCSFTTINVQGVSHSNKICLYYVYFASSTSLQQFSLSKYFAYNMFIIMQGVSHSNKIWLYYVYFASSTSLQQFNLSKYSAYNMFIILLLCFVYTSCTRCISFSFAHFHITINVQRVSHSHKI